MKQYLPLLQCTPLYCNVLWYFLFHSISFNTSFNPINQSYYPRVGLNPQFEKHCPLIVGFYPSLVLGFGSWGGHWAPNQKSGNSSTLGWFFLKMHSFWNKRKFCLSRCYLYYELSIQTFNRLLIFSFLYSLRTICIEYDRMVEERVAERHRKKSNLS